MDKCKLTGSKLSRYIHEIMSHDIEIQYIKGSSNIFADMLSRIPRNQELQRFLDQRERKEHVVMALDKCVMWDMRNVLKDLESKQKADPIIQKLRETAKDIGVDHDAKYSLFDGLLYKLDGSETPRWKVYIPASIESEVISKYHVGLCHLGVERTVLTIQDHLYIKKLGRRARQIISKCELCQQAKPANIRFDVQPQAILRDSPRALITVDHHGPMPTSTYGHKYIFVVFDVFSKFVKIYPVKWATAKIAASKITNEYMPKYGKIDTILSDNATAFRRKVWQKAMF